MKHIHVGEDTPPEGKFYLQLLLNWSRRRRCCDARARSALPTSRVITPRAAQSVARVPCRARGTLTFTIDGGCCEGTAPHLFEDAVLAGVDAGRRGRRRAGLSAGRDDRSSTPTPTSRSTSSTSRCRTRCRSRPSTVFASCCAKARSLAGDRREVEPDDHRSQHLAPQVLLDRPAVGRRAPRRASRRSSGWR